MNNRGKNYFQYFLVFSLVIHIICFIAPNTSPTKPSSPNNVVKQKLQFITLKSLTPRNIILSKHRKIREQVVNTSVQNSIPIKVKTRFLGKKTQSVSKQTIARTVGHFQDAGRGNNHQSSSTTNDHAYQRQISKSLTLKSLAIGNLLLGQAQAAFHPSAHRQGAKHGSLKKTGLAQSNDFIEDIPLGDTTYLNTVEFKFFGFYERIRKRLEIFWGKSIQQKARQIISRGGRIPASRNLMTSLLIEINNKGVITNIKIKGSSGYKELDSAAVESFNQAGPFPNPPQDMVKKGKATLEWGFVVNS